MFPEKVPPVEAGTVSATSKDLNAIITNSSEAVAPEPRTTEVPLVAVKSEASNFTPLRNTIILFVI